MLQDSNLWLTFSFLIFSFIVWRMGKPAIMGMIDNYIAQVKDDIAAAQALRDEAHQLLSEYQTKHRDAMKEAEKILAGAKRQAEEIRRMEEKELADSMARRERHLAQRLEMMKNAAIQDIKQYAADLAVKATTEIIQEKLDAQTRQTLIDQSINDVAAGVH